MSQGKFRRQLTVAGARMRDGEQPTPQEIGNQIPAHDSWICLAQIIPMGTFIQLTEAALCCPGNLFVKRRNMTSHTEHPPATTLTANDNRSRPGNVGQWILGASGTTFRLVPGTADPIPKNQDCRKSFFGESWVHESCPTTCHKPQEASLPAPEFLFKGFRDAFKVWTF